MCRWLAYSGAPLALDEFLFKAENSLIQQSRHATMAEETLQGDGFGVGWYGKVERPGRYTSILPAWNDDNLLNLAEQIESRLFMAHVRATTGAAIQSSNCHPFRYRNWLFQHNGLIRDFRRVRRDLHFAVASDLYPNLLGTTDSEIMFHLALTYGLTEDPPRALALMVGHVEAVCEAAGIENPVQMTVAVSNGLRLWAVRYSSEHASRSLFHSTSIRALQEINPAFSRYSQDAVLVVSEPLNDLTGLWQMVEEATLVEVANGEVRHLPFVPIVPDGLAATLSRGAVLA